MLLRTYIIVKSLWHIFLLLLLHYFTKLSVDIVNCNLSLKMNLFLFDLRPNSSLGI